MTKKRFVSNHLPFGSNYQQFVQGRSTIDPNTLLEGPRGIFFATLKSEFEKIQAKGARHVTDSIGVPRPPCNELVAVHFEAESDLARIPTEVDSGGNPNWSAGGRTKNLATSSPKEGVLEFVFDPMPASVIVSVDDLGHVS